MAWTVKLTNVIEEYDTVQLYVEFSDGNISFEKIYHFHAHDDINPTYLINLFKAEIDRLKIFKTNVAKMKEKIGQVIATVM